MKGAAGGSSYNLPAKRRWKGLAIAVLGLVFLSMLVPLAFLLGLHSGFHSYSGFTTEQGTSDSVGLQFQNSNIAEIRNKSKESQSRHVDDLIRILGPKIAKGFGNDSDDKAKNDTHVLQLPPQLPEQHPKTNSTRSSDKGGVAVNMNRTQDSRSLCELKFGSYCLWRQEHRDRMPDSTVKKMKDLLYVARAYYPSIAKLPALDKLSHDLKQNIQEFERILSEATTDKDLPPETEKKLDKMEVTVAKAKSVPVDCNNVDKKFRQLVDLTEDEANFHMKQSAFLFQLAIQTMPKSLHCLSMRLTVEYFRSTPPDLDSSQSDKLLNPELHHYVIFSNNVLASSAVINSTVMNAEGTSSLVFHVLTDRQNYFAMKLWFFLNKYKEATVQVLDIEEMDNHYKVSNFNWLLPQEFRVSFHGIDKFSKAWTQTEYVSAFSHAHYLLPHIFRTLRKVVILDHDIIVQRDLSTLWSIDLGGKVNGAMLLCTVSLSQLKDYLGDNSFHEDSCAWMSGVNIIDLDKWRELNLTKTYQRLVDEKMGTEEELSEAVVLRATLLTFQGLIFALDDSWVLSGLGYNYGLNTESIKKAAVLHFNGNMKPWLELGIPKYKSFWKKYLISESSFLSECNVIQ